MRTSAPLGETRRPRAARPTQNTKMDWNSRRLTAVIENALLEDRATRDATSYACIEANQRSAGTIIAKQDCILAGIGCVARILDVYAALDGAVTSHYEVTTHPEIFDGIRLPVELFLHWSVRITTGADRSRSRLKCGPWRNWNRPWSTAPRLFCWMT